MICHKVYLNCKKPKLHIICTSDHKTNSQFRGGDGVSGGVSSEEKKKN